MYAIRSYYEDAVDQAALNGEPFLEVFDLDLIVFRGFGRVGCHRAATDPRNNFV